MMHAAMEEVAILPPPSDLAGEAVAEATENIRKLRGELRELQEAVAKAIRDIYRAAVDGDAGDVACIVLRDIGKLLPEEIRPDPSADYVDEE